MASNTRDRSPPLARDERREPLPLRVQRVEVGADRVLLRLELDALGDVGARGDELGVERGELRLGALDLLLDLLDVARRVRAPPPRRVRGRGRLGVARGRVGVVLVALARDRRGGLARGGLGAALGADDGERARARVGVVEQLVVPAPRRAETGRRRRGSSVPVFARARARAKNRRARARASRAARRSHSDMVPPNERTTPSPSKTSSPPSSTTRSTNARSCEHTTTQPSKPPPPPPPPSPSPSRSAARNSSSAWRRGRA